MPAGKRKIVVSHPNFSIVATRKHYYVNRIGRLFVVNRPKQRQNVDKVVELVGRGQPVTFKGEHRQDEVNRCNQLKLRQTLKLISKIFLKNTHLDANMRRI